MLWNNVLTETSRTILGLLHSSMGGVLSPFSTYHFRWQIFKPPSPLKVNKTEWQLRFKKMKSQNKVQIQTDLQKRITG